MSQTTTLTIKARYLRIGDRILSVSGMAHPVNFLTLDSVEIKTKLVHVTSPLYKRKFTIFLDDDVDIEREVPTEEELTAQRRARQLDYIQNFKLNTLSSLVNAKDVLIAELDSSSGNYCWRLETYITIQTQCSLWHDVEDIMTGDDADISNDELSASQMICTRVIAELARSRFSNRSTSVLYNALEDCVREAKARWVRDIETILAD